MAAANKPTGVHVSLIIFVMSTIIFGVMWYMEMGERTTARSEATKAKADLSTAERAQNNLKDDLNAVMDQYGGKVPLENIGRGAEAGETTQFIPSMKSDITTFAKDLAKQTTKATLAEMSSRINTLTQEKNNLQAQLNDSQAKILSLQNEMQVRVDQYAAAATDEKKRAEKSASDLDEAIKGKNLTIDELNKRLSDERVQAEATQDRLQKQIDKVKKDYDALVAANNKLQDELQDVQQFSFEVPDGEIRWVDHAAGLVWINLGEADKLPPRTSFSVYTKAHHGVARGNEDVKGAIEVTRPLGPHLSEARILRTDNLRPIAIGDPIYTPLWSAGKVEYFALLGKIDFDGDGRDDRARLHELIAATGAKIESEVDDKGVLNGPGITVRTRFLVKGEIPSPLTSQLLPDEVEAANKMNELDAQLTAQARQQGVRVVSLNDFLNYIGYTSTRRMWAPNENRPYALKTQAPKLGIDETNPMRTHATRPIAPTGRGARVVEGQKKKNNQPKAAEDETYKSK